MKWTFIALLIMGLSCLSANACDICGCGTSNLNPFLFPYLSKNYLGIGYMHRVYHIYPSDGMQSKEYYNTYSITGQYSIGKRWQLVAVIPYLNSKMINANGTTNLSGVGDITLAANYKLFDKQNGLSRHSIIIGGGVKLASGSYKASATAAADEQNFQLGTGSFDYLLNGAYRFSYKKWAFSTAASYKYTTANKDHYRFGDVFSANEMAVYRIDHKKISISPYVQVIYEKQMQNADNHKLQAETAGTILYTGAGVDVSSGRFSFGVNYQAAAHQNLAEHMINAKPRLAAQVSFTF